MTHLAISLVLPYRFVLNKGCSTPDDSLPLMVALLSHLSYFDSFDSCLVKMTHLAISLVLPYRISSNEVCLTQDGSFLVSYHFFSYLIYLLQTIAN